MGSQRIGASKFHTGRRPVEKQKTLADVKKENAKKASMSKQTPEIGNELNGKSNTYREYLNEKITSKEQKAPQYGGKTVKKGGKFVSQTAEETERLAKMPKASTFSKAGKTLKRVGKIGLIIGGILVATEVIYKAAQKFFADNDKEATNVGTKKQTKQQKTKTDTKKDAEKAKDTSNKDSGKVKETKKTDKNNSGKTVIPVAVKDTTTQDSAKVAVPAEKKDTTAQDSAKVAVPAEKKDTTAQDSAKVAVPAEKKDTTAQDSAKVAVPAEKKDTTAQDSAKVAVPAEKKDTTAQDSAKVAVPAEKKDTTAKDSAKVAVPAEKKVDSKKADKAEAKPKFEVNESGEYTVKTGDNIWNIAKAQIASENNGAKPTNAQIAKRTKEILELNNLKYEKNNRTVIIHTNQKLKLTA
ncbi:LysM peptidoglycan-binding domain-containing protein [bacterium]|nr:LysM peptidoglycan-binding domain-containing protein [bacterium]